MAVPRDSSADRPPLAGVRIVDFGQYVAGPLAGMLLADQGAEVIKVDPPDGPPFASPAAAVFNRGKRIVSLDLKAEKDRDQAVQLIGDADVVIENFRPGVTDRLGVGPDAMTQANPGLVYLSMPGFASTDLENRDLPAWEGIMSAACGLFSDLNVLRDFLRLPPLYSPLPHASVYGAVHGALAVMIALTAREDSGMGDVIEVPLVSAGLSAMGSQQLMNVPTQPPRYDLPNVPRTVRRSVLPAVRRGLAMLGPRAQKKAYDAAQRMVPALLDSYPCADGRLLYIYALDHARLAVTLLDELGLLDELTAEGLTNQDPYNTEAHADNLADSSVLAPKRQTRLRRALTAKLREKPAEQWESQLTAAGVTCVVQRTTAEWLALAPLHDAGIVVEREDPRLGRVRQPGAQAWVEGALPAPGAPARSVDIDALFAERKQLGPPGPATAEPTPASADEPQAALAGALVVDLSTMIAGPACARTLAEYGARVVKVESPRPLHGPRMTCWLGIDVDQGKESMLLDIADQTGREILGRLLDRADVLVHNLSHKAVKRLDLGNEALLRRNPRLIICRTGAYEGPEAGPWSYRKAYDPVLQAASGIMLRYGSPRRPEHHGLTSCVDYLTAYSAAFAVALGLYHRARDPEQRGCVVGTSLSQAAQLIQATLAIDFDGRTWNEPSGQESVGDRALHRLYRTRDGWLFLAAPDGKRTALRAVAELDCPAEIARGGDEDLAAFLSSRLRRRRTHVWHRAFRGVDIGVYPVERFDDIRERIVSTRGEERILCGGGSLQVVRQPHPAGGLVDTVAPAHARPRRRPLRYLAPAPKPGTDTRSLLAELGVGDDERKQLFAGGVAADALASAYLPP